MGILNKRTLLPILSFVLLVLVTAPLSLSAQTGIGIPCDGSNENPCGFGDFIQLIQNIINFLILIAIPLAAIAFAWSGFLLITSGGSTSKRDQAKTIFSKVALGLLIIVAAWLIVKLIVVALLEPSFYEGLISF